MSAAASPERTGAGRLLPRAETKFLPAGVADVAADGTFTGHASLFGEADLGRDVVLPGAFRKSLARRGPSGVRMLFQHDPATPIGVWLALREDARGLFVRGKVTPETAKGREVLALMRAGALDGLSIGFRTVRARSDRKTGLRHLIEVDLWEISVVTFPLLPAARVSMVKAYSLRSDARLLRAIRRATRAMR